MSTPPLYLQKRAMSTPLFTFEKGVRPMLPFPLQEEAKSTLSLPL